ncbi:hypothetical protein, partial [Parvimonas sp. D9]|uniref:hypothetical protein n=1 Tax=Parvimonas sp. D9 TaxID=3110689 RepID=UPI002B46F430
FFDRRSPNPQVSHGVISVSHHGEFVYTQSSSDSNSPVSQEGSDGASMEDFQANTADLTQVSEYLLEPVMTSDIDIANFHFSE